MYTCDMGKNKSGKKRTKSSESDTDVYSKAGRYGESPRGSQGVSDNLKVSDILSQTNSVLYETPRKSGPETSVFSTPMSDLKQCLTPVAGDSLTSVTSETSPSVTPLSVMASKTNDSSPSNMATKTSDSSPSNADIVLLLGKIHSRIASVEDKLSKLDSLERKVDHFDSELKKLWTHIEDRSKRTEERVQRVEDRMDGIELASGFTQDKISKLENDCTKLKDSVTYLQAQSMRNNLIFCNIPETPNEKPDETENKVRQFLVEKLKIAQETASSLKIERSHRMGPLTPGRSRNIVCKFNMYTDREMVRRHRGNLKGTDFFIHEQFPQEVANKRRSLVPKMKEAIRTGKRAWISYDTLYIDGKPVKTD